MSPAPVNISLNTPIAKTVPKAQVAPMLRSNTKEERPLPDEPVDGEYINPDDHIPDHHKKKQGEDKYEDTRAALDLYINRCLKESTV